MSAHLTAKQHTTPAEDALYSWSSLMAASKTVSRAFSTENTSVPPSIFTYRYVEETLPLVRGGMISILEERSSPLGLCRLRSARSAEVGVGGGDDPAALPEYCLGCR